MSHFVSEPIRPTSGSFDPESMARGEPGLPEGFTWRGRTYRIVSCREKEKVLGAGGKGEGRYLRRHRYRLRMDDGSLWVVYCLRAPQGPRGRGPRWVLSMIEEAGAGGGAS